jgi:hypothetical protein
MLAEFAEGKPLNPIELRKLPKERSERFYGQLSDVFRQLRRQEFSRIGSLTLDDEDHWTLDNPPLSIDLNDQQVYGLEPQGAGDGPYGSAIQYIFFLYHLLLNRFYKQRNSVWDEVDAKEKLYGLENVKGILFGMIKPELNYGPFVLMHGDLRPSNIIIDDDYNIRAIVDWEWSRTVPVQLFVPPCWFTGFDASVMVIQKTIYAYEVDAFMAQIKLPRDGDLETDPLQSEWSRETVVEPQYWLACALHRFCEFEGIFWSGLHKPYFPPETKGLVDEFFERGAYKPLLDVVKRKLEELNCYNADLQVAGLASSSPSIEPNDDGKDAADRPTTPSPPAALDGPSNDSIMDKDPDVNAMIVLNSTADLSSKKSREKVDSNRMSSPDISTLLAPLASSTGPPSKENVDGTLESTQTPIALFTGSTSEPSDGVAGSTESEPKRLVIEGDAADTPQRKRFLRWVARLFPRRI